MKRFKLSDVQKAREEAQGEAEWLLTYADMVTLLLTFFVMLYIIIEPSNQDYIGQLRKIGDAFGGKSLVERQAEIEKVREDVDAIVRDNNLTGQVQVGMDARGIVLFAEGDLFFKAGGAELTDDIKFFLKRIGSLLKENQYKVLVEGHTDDVPIKSPAYPTNWELSTARASTVVRYFIDQMEIEPRRFTAMGYANYKPRYPVTPENRPRNRRVEIVITRDKM